jgi:uroporphyrinogen III methyltransferase/synthase
LARLQADEALPALQVAFPGVEFEKRTQETIGDRDLITPLTDESIPTDFFTRELDRAQLAGEIDLVIHSAKDLPDPLPEGLVIAAMLPAQDTRDALIVRPGVDLTEGGVIGTSSPIREAAIRQLYPKTTCKAIRGSIGQRINQADAGDYDAVIIAGCALQRLGLEPRISEWLDYETTPLQGRLAITVKADREDLVEGLSLIDVRRTSGLVALVGCPADARLLGGQALQLIEAADIVLHDRLIPQRVLNSLGNRGEYVGKKGHSHSTTQAHIHRRILHEAERGKLVVRLHGGEPGVLGHLGETLSYCQAWNLRTEVVPAVSAAQITAAKARCSLTHRNQGRSITFLSGHKGLNDHPSAALSPDHGHLAIYMGVRDAPIIRENLQKAGWPAEAPVTIGLDLGTEQEEILLSSVKDFPEEPLRSPAVMLVGPEPHPEQTTLFTGTDPSKFLKYGPFLHVPMIKITPSPLQDRVEVLRQKLLNWDGIIFPSSPAVQFFMEALLAETDVRALAGKQILAVGPLTAHTLKTYGINADGAPEGFGGAAALAQNANVKPGRYGYPTSDQSPVEDRQKALVSKGIRLDPVVFYINQPTNPEKLPRQSYHRVLFTSGSTVRAYFDRFPDEKTKPREWIAVGTSTRKAIEQLGLKGKILR